MDTTELYRLCGISQAPAQPTPSWVNAEMRFIGADRYVLGSKLIRVQFSRQHRGFNLRIDGPTSIPTSMLLGTKRIEGKLYDVELHTAELTLSLAALCKGGYPKILRANEVVELTS